MQLLSRDELAQLASEVHGLWHSGRLQPSALGGGASGSARTSYTHRSARGDLIGWFSGDEGSATANSAAANGAVCGGGSAAAATCPVPVAAAPEGPAGSPRPARAVRGRCSLG